MQRKEKGNTRSIRALVDPRHITMVSVALLAHRSSRGKDGFVHESKEIKHRKGKSMQIEKEKKFQTLTLGKKGNETYLGPCATAGRCCATGSAPLLTGALHREEPPLDHRDVGGARVQARQPSAVNGTLDGGALTHG